MTTSCSVLAQELAVPIAGTAVEQTTVWIVLEHRGAWPAKAVRDGDLPDAVKQRLMQWEEDIAGARVQLVRRSGRSEPGVSFWIGVSELGRSTTRRWSLGSSEDLLGLDVPALVEAIRSGASIEGATEPDQPLVLVCTNGRRDVCCSVRGTPVAQALTSEAGLDVWQTTHLGGHRFAATLVVLPQGICYGWVEPHEVPALAEAIRGGRVFRLDRLRGRTALASCEQVAEAAWRQRESIDDVDALVHAEHREVGGGVLVTLRDRTGAQHELRMEHRMLGVSAPTSCGKPPEALGAWFVLDA